jgi:hypothetical protein
MAEELCCYRCGSSLAALSLPLSRQDECPSCSVYLHVCRMCRFFDPQVPRQCREDDAEDVTEKERQNFCDWFKPDANVFDAARFGQEQQAKSQLTELFGDSGGTKKDVDAAASDAEDLFK